MTKKLIVLSVVLIFALGACKSPLTSVETAVPKHSDKPIEQGNSCEGTHPWDGDALTFKSETVGITVEFPAEWASLINVYDEETNIRIDVIKGWDTKEITSGLIAKIYCFTKYDWEDKTGSIPVEIFDSGDTCVMAENDESVIVLYRYGGLVNYEDNKAPGFAEYQEISQGLQDEKYHAYFS
ncbi:MAG: hypothetical protein EOM52_02070 [Clostridia bacterium]|nr:hypothetical protein [Clostridia bacterium]